jgi:stage IV sporulation protein A
VNGLLEEYGTDEDKLWKTELFGKSLRELVDGGLTQKSGGMPEPLQRKMRKALSKIVNDGRGNILCILL